VAYQDGANGGKVTVVKFDSGTNMWEVIGTPGFSSGFSVTLSLSLYNGTPYVAY
jgi:hypothetical protein